MFSVLEAERPAGSLYCSYITHCAELSVTLRRWQTATCSLRGFGIRVCQAGLCRVCCFYFLLLHLASVHHVSRWLLLVNPKEEVAQTTSCFLRVLDFVLIHYWCPERSTLQFPTQTSWKTPACRHFVPEPVCSLLHLKEPAWVFLSISCVFFILQIKLHFFPLFFFARKFSEIWYKHTHCNCMYVLLSWCYTACQQRLSLQKCGTMMFHPGLCRSHMNPLVPHIVIFLVRLISTQKMYIN